MSRTPRKKRRRPKSYRIGVVITDPELEARIRAFAAADKRSASSLGALALEEYLAVHEPAQSYGVPKLPEATLPSLQSPGQTGT